MHPRTCAACGGAVETSSSPVPFEVRGEIVVVDGISHGLCAVCGEVYLSLEAAELLQKAALAKSKAARQLLSSDEIRDLRHSLGMSQAAFEELLGIGAKTVVRWENGTVFQSATADRLMRLVRMMPQLAGVLASGELYSLSRPGVDVEAHPELVEEGQLIAREGRGRTGLSGDGGAVIRPAASPCTK